jgi:23S rRNA (cytosine1962-C5)-methyltransferase
MELVMADVILKPGRDKPVRQHHPWIFSGAVARVKGDVTDGDVVDVIASEGAWLARGTLNRKSQIVVRLLTWRQDEAIDEAFWRSRLERAIAGRALLASSGDTMAYRLVNAESDGLPGFIVDRYGDYLVTQFITWASAVEERIVGQVARPAKGCTSVVTWTCAPRKVCRRRRAYWRATSRLI